MGEELIDVLILQKVCMVLLFSGAPFFFFLKCALCVVKLHFVLVSFMDFS